MRRLIFIFATAVAACNPATEQSTPEVAATEAYPEIRFAGTEINAEDMEGVLLGSINPFENDLRGLEVAIRLREEFRTKSDGVKFVFAVMNAEGEKPLDETFDLEPTSGIDSLMIASQQREGFYIRTYRLAETDKPRMAEADTTLQALKATSTGGNELQFQAEALTCVEPDVAMPEAYSLTMYVRTHSGVDFIALNQELLIDNRPDGSMAAMFEVCAD